ncbi:hypothetical protein ACFL1N_01240 [Thermodesulfobacteriota bacterium]
MFDGGVNLIVFSLPWFAEAFGEGGRLISYNKPETRDYLCAGIYLPEFCGRLWRRN